MGTTEMFYALTQGEEDYFEARLNKAIMLAPCLYPSNTGLSDY